MTEETKKQAFEKVSNSIADITQNNYSTDLLTFSKGFDAGYQIAMDEANERIQKLRGALEFYASGVKWASAYSNDYGQNPMMLNEKDHDWIVIEKECELIGGKTARAALKEDDLNK